MNIFMLACSARAAADLHCDQHVCKMIVETAQLLYTYLHSIGHVSPVADAIEGLVDRKGKALEPYKATHTSHPCGLWLHGGRAHFFWLCELGLRLCDRFELIYGNVHRTATHLLALYFYTPPERLPANCWPAEWLRRLAAHGVKKDVIAHCAATVCLADPPDGCHFGVACMGDEVVPLECDEDGHASAVYSTRSVYGHKSAVDFRMTWEKLDVPPLALEDWVM